MLKRSKKKYFVALLLIMIVPVSLCAEFRYLSEEVYKDLSKKERMKYWEDLENELMVWQKREADARAAIPKNEDRIAELRKKIKDVDEEYDKLYNRILTALGGVSHSEIVEFQNQLEKIKAKLDYYGQMPNSELYKNDKGILAFIDNYNKMKDQNIARIPKFAAELVELDRRITKLRSDLEHAKPKYYEDTHEVVNGECLWKISGYEHIYNDPIKWGNLFTVRITKFI